MKKEPPCFSHKEVCAILIERELIQKAKETLGDTNADLIADLLKMDKYNQTRKVGCCPNPMHDDHNPSCSYNPKTYSFHCWSCGFDADIITAYMIAENCSFLQACEKLFDLAGIQHDFTERGVLQSREYRYPHPEYAKTKEHVYEYWESRCISPSTIDYLDIQEDKNGNTLFQYRDLNDVLVTVKVRKSGPVKKGENKCWCLPGSDVSHILYNINKITPEMPLIITSGEGDCATCIECGFYNAVSINLGDKNTQWISECWDFLQQFNEIYLVHDNDESGRNFAREVTSRLGEYRVKVVDIPSPHIMPDGNKIKVKDLNELLYYEGKDAVREAINNASMAEIPAIIDYTDVTKFDMSDVPGFTTGFFDMDVALDKFYLGTTTILTGIAGSGKSSFLSTLICKSVEQGFPCFVYSGELSNPSLKNWVDFVHAGQRGINAYISPANKTTYYKIKPDVFTKINETYKGRLFFYRDGFDHKVTHLLQTAESVVRRNGVKTLIFDNMTSVDLENSDKDKYIKQEEFIRNVIEFSKRWQVCCIVVLHPRKLDMVKRMGLFDLQGVTAAVNLAHRVLSLYRVTQEEKVGKMSKGGTWIKKPIPYDVIIDVLKDRFGSAAGKEIGLFYDVPSKRFFDSKETLDHQYEWDKECHEHQPLPFGIPQFDQVSEIYGDV